MSTTENLKQDGKALDGLRTLSALPKVMPVCGTMGTKLSAPTTQLSKTPAAPTPTRKAARHIQPRFIASSFVQSTPDRAWPMLARVGLLVADKRKKRPTSVSLWGVRRRAGRRHHALRPASVTDLRQ